MFNKSILIAEDMPALLTVIEKILIRNGFNKVLKASDGEVAWEVMSSNLGTEDEVGLIICDWNMPNLSGLELLERMKSKDELSEIPFIMVTTEGAKTKVVEALLKGVSNYLVKPIDEDALVKKVNKVLNL